MLSTLQSQIHPQAQAVQMLDQAWAICSFTDKILVLAVKPPWNDNDDSLDPN